MSLFGISLTGDLKDLINFQYFSPEVIDLLRNAPACKAITILDTGWGLPDDAIRLVKDHINLTGTNPLLGQNHLCGPRFVKMTDIYIQAKDDVHPVTVAGLKKGIVPNDKEFALLKDFGVDCWSYNLVQTSIIAAHVGLKICGILLSENSSTTNLPVGKLF